MDGRKRYQAQRASWVDDGLVLGWGNHEALIFRVRKGGGAPYEQQCRQWQSEHTEETVIAAKEAGIEVFHTHGYKGFGYEAEKPEMEMLADLSRLVHKHGMRLDSYCQVMTIVPETFFAEEPRAEEWVQRDEDGRPILLTYGNQQSWRYKPNLLHPEYREYYKEKIVRTLIEKCDADLIHFDNYDANREPDSDRSPVAVQGFKDYLERKYPTDEQRIDRFGHTHLQTTIPPVWNKENRPENAGVIVDPVQQEWIDFRCWVMADWLREMTEFARSLKPDIAIDVNPHGLMGRNRAYQAALWHPWFMKYTEVIWSEEVNNAEYNSRGVLISKIRSYKLGRALDNVLLTYKGDDRHYAEGLAFNQAPGNIQLGGRSRRGASHPSHRKYYDFYIRNRELYTCTVNREDAALLRSYATMAYDDHRAELEQCMFEQAMIQGQVPFDLVFDEQMDDLSRYRVIVLAGQNNLAAEHADRIRAFVEQGGGLVLTGASSGYDGWGRKLTTPSLAEVMGMDESWIPDGSSAFSNKTEVAADGRVIYVPRIVPPDKHQADSWTGSWDGNEGIGTWILPANSEELVHAVRQAAGGRLSVEAGVPDHVAVEQVRKEGLIVVHLVNFKKDSKLANIPVEVRIDPGSQVDGITLTSPDRADDETLLFTMDGDHACFVVPDLQVYDVIAIRLS